MGGIGLDDQGLAMEEMGVKLKNLGQIDAFQPIDHKIFQVRKEVPVG